MHKVDAVILQRACDAREIGILLPRQRLDEPLRENKIRGEIRCVRGRRLQQLVVILDQHIVRVLKRVEIAAHARKADDVDCYSCSPFAKLDTPVAAQVVQFGFERFEEGATFAPENGIQVFDLLGLKGGEEVLALEAVLVAFD